MKKMLTALFVTLGIVTWYGGTNPLYHWPSAYPNSIYTPGLADTLKTSDLTASYSGLTYSQSHRNVTQATKKKVLAEYGNPTSKVEIDHFWPVCAGGSNDVKNLWPMPEHQLVNGEDMGYPVKDKLEAKICEGIKAGTIDPTVAYKNLTKDWIAYYHVIFPTTFGAISTPVDNNNEDEVQ